MAKLSFCILFLIMSTASVFAENRIPVFVSIVPQKYFVQQIGRDFIDVQVIVQPGMSPATYEPKSQQMANLSKTKVYFAIGVPFENAWLKKIAAANPKMKVVHTDHGIEKIPMAAHHHHNETGAHHNLDPHIWLSPSLVKIQARSILTTLQEIDPAHKDVYLANYRQFVSAIDELDADLNTTFADKNGRQFMVFHPSWGYFARDYGLEQVPIEIEGKAPKPAQLKELIEHAREEDIRVIFVQPQFSTKSAQLVAREINGRVITADSLAADWMTNLRNIADKFTAALK